MDALLQIGKDLASLEARMNALESAKCSCKSKARGLKDSKLPRDQRAVVTELRAHHAEIFAALNAILKKFKLPEGLVLGSFKLVDASRLKEDDVDMCCICCADGSGGYEYCCDYNGCACC